MKMLDTNAVIKKIEEMKLREATLTESIESIVLKNLEAMKNENVSIDKTLCKYFIENFRNEYYIESDRDLLNNLPFIVNLDDTCLALIYCAVYGKNPYRDIYPLNSRGTDYNYKKSPTRVYFRDEYKMKLKRAGYDIEPLDVLDILSQ